MVFKPQPGSGRVRTAPISDVDLNYSELPRCRSAALALVIGRFMVKENLQENGLSTKLVNTRAISSTSGKSVVCKDTVDNDYRPANRLSFVIVGCSELEPDRQPSVYAVCRRL